MGNWLPSTYRRTHPGAELADIPGVCGSLLPDVVSIIGDWRIFLKDRGDQTRFTLSAAQMKALNKALDAPARELPGLKRLFAKPSVFPAVSP